MKTYGWAKNIDKSKRVYVEIFISTAYRGRQLNLAYQVWAHIPFQKMPPKLPLLRACLSVAFQAGLQGILFITELLTYFLLSGYASNKWLLFALTTVSWCLVNGMDGWAFANKITLKTSVHYQYDFVHKSSMWFAYVYIHIWRSLLRKIFFCEKDSTDTSSFQGSSCSCAIAISAGTS